MSVKVTFEFANAEEAIVALGKIIGAPTTAAVPPAPPAEKPARKSRADKGQQREPYGPRNLEANAAVEAGTSTTVGSGAAGAQAGVTDPGKTGEKPADPTSTVPPVAPATPPAAVPVPKPEEVQAAVEKLFNAKGFEDCAALLSRFGVKRGKDLPQDQRQNFINRVNGVVDRGEAI